MKKDVAKFKLVIIQISNLITGRPDLANNRERLGDWEADTVMGQTGKACLVTLTDRKSRYLLCKKIAKKNSFLVKQAMIELLENQPLETITPDRGKEISKHAEISQELNLVEFFSISTSSLAKRNKRKHQWIVERIFPENCGY